MAIHGFMGVDPGITCGIAWATWGPFSGWSVRAASCDLDAMLEVLGWRLRDWQRDGVPVTLQGEKFETGNRPGAKGRDADCTRRGLEYVLSTARDFGATFVTARAADVKPWATDKRLAAIGFPLAPKLRDARDAGRHMLYAAVRSGRAPDPLR